LKLHIDGVSKQYKGKVALANFEAEFTEGVHALLGPNGAGKSTLMRIIAGVLRPTSGKVCLDGESTVAMGERYRDVLGYLPQSFGLYKNFTAERFLLYIAALKGLDKSVAPRKVAETLSLVGLGDVGKLKVGKLSGGMKQRLGIAQALLNNPKVLIVDEPTAGLDPKERIRFRNLLSEFARDRIVVLSTHIISDVEVVAQDVYLMNRGQLLAKNTAEGFLADMVGKVWTLTCAEREIGRYERKFQVGNVSRIGQDVKLRILSDQAPSIQAVAAEPTLEDMYLYYFKEEAAADEVHVVDAV